MSDTELALLRTVLALLAADPERQVRELPAFRQTAAQLRDGVVDLFRIDDSLAAQGALPPGVPGTLRALDARFDEMLEAGDVTFSEEAIRESEEWRAVRTLASEALALLG